MNEIRIHGRLTRDPELKTCGSGIEFCKFTVAVDRRQWKDKEKQTDFFDCTAFNERGVAISKYFTKGKEILLGGRMESSKSLKEGQTRTYWGITVEWFEFCGSRSDQQAAAPAPTVDAQSGMEQVDPEGLPF